MLGVVVVGLESPKQGDQSGCLGGFVEGEDVGEVLDVVEDLHGEKGLGRRTVFTPLQGQGFQVSTAGPGIFRRCPQCVEDKVIQKLFQCAPFSVASVIGFHNPELGRAICQRVGDLAELDCVNYFVMWYRSSSTWDIAVGNGIKIIIRGRSHICGHNERTNRYEYWSQETRQETKWKCKHRVSRKRSARNSQSVPKDRSDRYNGLRAPAQDDGLFPRFSERVPLTQ